VGQSRETFAAVRSVSFLGKLPKTGDHLVVLAKFDEGFGGNSKRSPCGQRPRVRFAPVVVLHEHEARECRRRSRLPIGWLS